MNITYKDKTVYFVLDDALPDKVYTVTNQKDYYDPKKTWSSVPLFQYNRHEPEKELFDKILDNMEKEEKNAFVHCNSDVACIIRDMIKS